MNTAVLNFKTNPVLKRELQAVARELGLSVGAILNAYARELVRERRVVFSAPPALNRRTASVLERIGKDLRVGKNSDGPFTPREALGYLDSI